MCSQKWARPGREGGSAPAPTFTEIEQEDLGEVGEEVRRRVRLLGRR